MLAVVCEAKTRGMSSFGRLANYLQFGSGSSLKIDEETGEAIERGDMYYADAILDSRNAVAEMAAVAAQNGRIRDPIFHYILAWQEGERPAREQWQVAVGRTQAAMEMGEHQYIAALHQDGTTWHVHVLSNRVHPDSYRGADLWKCHERLDLAIREIEHVQGWKPSRGLARWDNGQAVLLSKQEKNTQRATRLGRMDATRGMPVRMETWRDAESFVAWLKAEPAQTLNDLMKRAKVSWQDVHAELASFGLELRRAEHAGLAGYMVVGRDERGREIHARASDAFRKHFAGKAAREATRAKLGEWVGSSARVTGTEGRTPAAEQPTQKTGYSSDRTRRDPYERAERKAERDRARAGLKADYQTYRRDWWQSEQRRRAAEALQMRAAMGEISARRRERSQEIRARRLPRELRQVGLSIIAAEAIQARALLRAELAEARLTRRVQDYRNWVGVRAAEGRADAIAQLRGFHYSEQRRAGRDESAADGIGDWSGTRSDPAAPRGFSAQQPDALALSWTVDRNRGHVQYSLSGVRAFTDEGSVLRMVRQEDTDRQRAQLRVALQLAVQKWGRELSLDGSDAFRRAAAEEAVRMGLTVKFKAAEDERYRQQFAGQGRDGTTGAAASFDPLARFRTLAQDAAREGDALQMAIAKARLGIAQEYQRNGKTPMHHLSEIEAEAQRRVLNHLKPRHRTEAAPAVGESEERARQYVHDFRQLAARRRIGAPGYADDGHVWRGLDATLRERIERFNAVPALEQDEAAENLEHETTRRYSEDPEAAAREALSMAAKDRGRGR